MNVYKKCAVTMHVSPNRKRTTMPRKLTHSAIAGYLCTIPPQTDTKAFSRHTALYAVGRFNRRVFSLCRSYRRLVMPLFVNDLQSNHFVGIIEQSLILI